MDQIVQAEDVPIQLMVVKMLDQIITDYGSAYMMLEDEDSSSAQLSSSIDDLRIANDFSTSIPPSSKLYHLVRILLDTFTFHVPAISRNPAAASKFEVYLLNLYLKNWIFSTYSEC